jgi:hypothetical protein
LKHLPIAGFVPGHMAGEVAFSFPPKVPSSPASADKRPGPSSSSPVAVVTGRKRGLGAGRPFTSQRMTRARQAQVRRRKGRENFLILWACLTPSYHLPFPLPNYLPHQLSLTFPHALHAYLPRLAIFDTYHYVSPPLDLLRLLSPHSASAI